MKLNFVEAGVRQDLAIVLGDASSELSNVGAWLDGAERLAVVQETRRAWECDLCQRRRDALSPSFPEGDHQQATGLPDSWIEVVHKVGTDSGRITRSWYDSVIGETLCEDEFIEVLSVTCIATGIDTFVRGIGADPMELPHPVDGRPARKRPGGVQPGPGWAPTVSPEDAGPELGDFYDLGPYYIRRALTLVPEEANRFWNLMNVLYLPDPGVEGLGEVERGITRAQIEFLAARVSALLGCYY